jgi:hypothetical protein
VTSRVLLRTADLTLGAFACASGDRMWDEVNDIGARPHVVFPRTHVLIAQDGARPVLATPSSASPSSSATTPSATSATAFARPSAARRRRCATPNCARSWKRRG